ncbi:SafA/ExsA family spore coat assembly protein [Ornithinibacillus gellani]|uniref:SafA/ExsA family spore coat assembly protein n=1 Tax=Ornithinibacillus gellani TaxID=2293253 RepID=UPI001CC20CFF|nr:SafA/ExsA family spore coat assembly protein [Ornithinibacillus gellani]
MRIYIVKKGDTLWDIAKKFGVDFNELQEINAQISSPDMIMPGMKIKIPGTAKAVKKEQQVKEKPKEQVKQPVTKQPKPIPKPIVKEDEKKQPNKVVPQAPKMEMPQQHLPKYPVMQMPIMEQPPSQYKPEQPTKEEKEVKKEKKETQKPVEQIPTPTFPETQPMPLPIPIPCHQAWFPMMHPCMHPCHPPFPPFPLHGCQPGHLMGPQHMQPSHGWQHHGCKCMRPAEGEYQHYPVPKEYSIAQPVAQDNLSWQGGPELYPSAVDHTNVWRRPGDKLQPEMPVGWEQSEKYEE